MVLDWVFAGLVCYLAVAAALNVVFPKPKTLWQRARWALIFEPVDFWIGVYYDREKRRVYLIVVPMFPLRYTRRLRANRS